MGAFMAAVNAVLRALSSQEVLPAELVSFLYLPLGLSLFSFLLAVLPTQRQHIRCANVIVIVVNSVITLASLQGDFQSCREWLQAAAGAGLPLWYACVRISIALIVNLGRLCITVYFARLLWARLPPRLHLDAIWVGMRRSMMFFTCVFSVEFVLEASTGFEGSQTYLSRLVEAASGALLTALAACPRLRVTVQAFLAERLCSTMAATAVGMLLSSRPFEQVLPLARERFRCVPLDRVTRAMIVDSEPNPELLKHTEPAALGEVDAFVSHSWHDAADAKWEALQEWRAEFKEVMGREPRVWFDKFCIDQTNIADSLVGLPVYLAGCDNLLILHGETYQRRLWCLMEIFTFIVMGGSVQNLVVRQLRTCQCDFAGFDARNATCFKKEDSSHLLSVIETGLGSIDKFNVEVRAMAGTQRSKLMPSPERPRTPGCGSAVSGSTPTFGWAVDLEGEEVFYV